MASAFGQPELNIFDNRQMGEKGVVLKHHTDPALFRRNVALAIGHELAIDSDRALGDRHKAGHRPQQAGLAAARGPEQASDIASIEGQRDPGGSQQKALRPIGVRITDCDLV